MTTKKAPITGPDIVEIGRALYGDTWKSCLSRALGVALKTIQRWERNENKPDDTVIAILQHVVERRTVEIERATAHLMRFTDRPMCYDRNEASKLFGDVA